MSSNGTNSDLDVDAVDKILMQEREIAEQRAEANFRILDNHLLHSDRVIANLAALQSIRDDTGNLERLLDIIRANPT